MGVRITGIEETRRRLQRLADRARALEDFLNGEAAALSTLIDESWANRTTPGGAGWQAEGENAEGGGTLSTAHTVAVTKTGLTLHVAHPAASFQFYGTTNLPARNPTPFDRLGKPIVEWADAHRARLKAFLLGGADGPMGGVHGR